ncbi:unnamed protein product [Cunninghamella blakesleeana]
MKFTAITGALALASVAQAVTVITPWANTTWTAGQNGLITWKADPSDAGLKCDIQLMNGDAKNANLVAYVTAAATPVDCSLGSYEIKPLNDFKAGQYSIRIGQKDKNQWAYSGLFNFVGKGSVGALQTAGQPAGGNGTAAASGAAANATPSGTANASGSNKPSGSSSAANASNSTNAAGSVNAMSMIGVAAIAGLSTLAMSL